MESDLGNNEQIQPYIEHLIKLAPNIESVWLMGSRTNNTYRGDSDWDLLVFADERTLEVLRGHQALRRDYVDVLVVYNGKDFVEPWPEVVNGRAWPKSGSLSGEKSFAWYQLSPTEAEYEGTKRSAEGPIVREVKRAIKLWPGEKAV
jgi:predicted nucleotidyltransferase